MTTAVHGGRVRRAAGGNMHKTVAVHGGPVRHAARENDKPSPIVHGSQIRHAAGGDVQMTTAVHGGRVRRGSGMQGGGIAIIQYQPREAVGNEGRTPPFADFDISAVFTNSRRPASIVDIHATMSVHGGGIRCTAIIDVQTTVVFHDCGIRRGSGMQGRGSRGQHQAAEAVADEGGIDPPVFKFHTSAVFPDFRRLTASVDVYTAAAVHCDRVRLTARRNVQITETVHDG